MKKIIGTIQEISCSPHGRTEGFVLEGNIFVKIPPHTLHAEMIPEVGDEVEVMGEVHESSIGKTIHHAKVFIGGELYSDNQLSDKEDEKLKKRHKKDNDSLNLVKKTSHTSEGEVIAVATKKHGEVDRVILEGGISVHVPKELELRAEDLHIGDYLIVDGEGRDFGARSYLKAEFIMNGDGQILSI